MVYFPVPDLDSCKKYCEEHNMSKNLLIPISKRSASFFGKR